MANVETPARAKLLTPELRAALEQLDRDLQEFLKAHEQ